MNKFLRAIKAGFAVHFKPDKYCQRKLAEYVLGYRDWEHTTFESCKLESLTKKQGSCTCQKFLYGRITQDSEPTPNAGAHYKRV